MPLDPITGSVIVLTALAKGAQDYFHHKSEKKRGERRAKETKRETHANLLQDQIHRRAEAVAHGEENRKKTAKRRADTMQETADLVRNAVNI